MSASAELGLFFPKYSQKPAEGGSVVELPAEREIASKRNDTIAAHDAVGWPGDSQ
jgi:hypothetical protein